LKDRNTEYVGIDVGGRRKGFHACALAGNTIAEDPERLADVDAVRRWLGGRQPSLIAVDSPRTCAPAPESSRPGERALKRSVCGIRWTPQGKRLEGNPYYEWIVCGFELYSMLEEDLGLPPGAVIEVFPTASWTRWAGSRGTRRRAAWTAEALRRLGLDFEPSRRLNQDDRDAIAAAVTARQHGAGESESFEEIVVPGRGRSEAGAPG
jgi:predicted nuclease with RNAse H fold